jgi:hypothetical protein
MSSVNLTPAAAGALAVLRACASPISTDELRQQTGLDYESGLDVLAELEDAGLIRIDGSDDLEVVTVEARKGPA